MCKFELKHSISRFQGEKACICGLAEVLKVRKSQKDMVHKSQIRKVSNMRKVRKSNKLFNSVSFRTFDMRNFFGGPLTFGV
jgi:hypothetical protein